MFLVIIPSNILEGIQDFNPATVLKNYTCRIIPLPSSPTHIDVNSDQKLLSVIFNRNEIPILRIYNIKTIFEAVSKFCSSHSFLYITTKFVLILKFAL